MSDRGIVDRLLVIDDEPAIRDSLKMTLDYEGYETLLASSARQGLELIEARAPALILLDVKMPITDGMELLRDLKTRGHDAPIVLISGHATAATAFEAARLGAYAVLEKPFGNDLLLLTVRNALRERRLQMENQDLRRKMESAYEIVGESPELAEVLRLVSRAAPTGATVLITGESGTGKELVARAIHRRSGRAARPFVQVNCAAIPEELIESELFGHEKGSFTGAVEKQIGKFLMADKGTIFLDEVGDMSAKTQAKVLRVLQEGDVEPIGAARTVKVDVRVVAATNKDLPKEIEAARFREDLFYRLNVIPIRVPSLSDRRADVPLLIDHFTRRYCAENNFRPKTFSGEALELLRSYRWPGNVRELRNVVERSVILTAGDVVNVADLPETIRPSHVEPMSDFRGIASLRELKDAAERAFLVAKLRENRWNISLTAQKIDTPRSNLYKKLEQYGISQERDG
ncbi:MAG: sigma-54 dependent transcriptional regulator [Acidobacteriota bacterium]